MCWSYSTHGSRNIIYIFENKILFCGGPAEDMSGFSMVRHWCKDVEPLRVNVILSYQKFKSAAKNQPCARFFSTLNECFLEFLKLHTIHHYVNMLLLQMLLTRNAKAYRCHERWIYTHKNCRDKLLYYCSAMYRWQ